MATDRPNIRLVTMTGSRAFVDVSTVAAQTGVPRQTWIDWLMDNNECSAMFLRSQEGLFVEASSVESVLRHRCTPAVCAQWMEFCRVNHTRRRLTEAEKKQVAAEQRWRCASCDCNLDATYEVDHIEQHAIRANNSRKNLQALCPACHRSKTREDRYFGDPLFETRKGPAPTNLVGQDGCVFSAFFRR